MAFQEASTQEPVAWSRWALLIWLLIGCVVSLSGDYFGILMEAKVTCFPFNVLENPMYWGSSTIYLGWSIM